ncbi:uncharacterized protein LOC124285748 [Haliotis rubra]|uniref:uncharacterized protein LOC124285748 n=1 Tax=Haliotis rubra TaxID=36100 RepID=UPI001EE5F064|nr:uncharacterized protein LOC124285748 [Haliotis rubra]
MASEQCPLAEGTSRERESSSTSPNDDALAKVLAAQQQQAESIKFLTETIIQIGAKRKQVSSPVIEVSDQQAGPSGLGKGGSLKRKASGECDSQKRCRLTADSDMSDAEDNDPFDDIVDTLQSDHEAESENEVDAVIFELNAYFNNDDKFGPKVNEVLGRTINEGLRSQLNLEALNQTKDKYQKPENCPNLTVPRVNNQVWNQVKPQTRSIDSKLQNVQSLLAKAFCPILELTDEVMNASRDKKQQINLKTLAKKSCDSLRLLSAVFVELTNHRKDTFKPELKGAYKQLCAHNNPVTDQLFGDDLAKQIKDISEAQTLSAKLSGGGDRPGQLPWKQTRGGKPSYVRRDTHQHQGRNDRDRRFLGQNRRNNFKRRGGYQQQKKQ